MSVAKCSQSVAEPYGARVSGQSGGVAVARSFLGYGYGYTLVTWAGKPETWRRDQEDPDVTHPEVKPSRASRKRERRVLPQALTTGNSSLDLSRAPELPSATPIPLSRKRFEVSDH